MKEIQECEKMSAIKKAKDGNDKGIRRLSVRNRKDKAK